MRLPFILAGSALILYHRGGLTLGWCSAFAETPDDYDANL